MHSLEQTMNGASLTTDLISTSSWTSVAAFAVGLPGIMGLAYFWPSTIPAITAPRSAIRPPQIKEWSADWNRGQRAKPFLAKSTLSEDQVAVYRAFLKS